MKIIKFLRDNINDFLYGITAIYLIGLILSNLFFITQTSTYFEVGKYALSTLLALLVIFLIKLTQTKDK